MSGSPLDVTLIIPPSFDIRTLARYAGLSNDDPLCDPVPRFHRLENMLTLDDDASREFRSLNVWLEETVRLSNFYLSSLSPTFLIPRFFFFFLVLPLLSRFSSSFEA